MSFKASSHPRAKILVFIIDSPRLLLELEQHLTWGLLVLPSPWSTLRRQVSTDSYSYTELHTLWNDKHIFIPETNLLLFVHLSLFHLLIHSFIQQTFTHHMSGSLKPSMTNSRTLQPLGHIITWSFYFFHSIYRNQKLSYSLGYYLSLPTRM